MTSQQFLSQLKQHGPAAAYLFIGPEPYQRDFCRKALLDRMLAGAEERENGLTRYDLQETPLEAIVDDARSLSLFASNRVIVVSNAEAALPRGKAAAAEEEGEPGAGGSKASAAALEAYLRDPAPGVVLLFEATRYEFQGEDKKKIERVQKFYSAIR
ncbi:MAG TPA: hypothetical protein VHA11_01165, partial [Bryobacteraceae bacterium]|nr:hypothetical protein [Bryobacteraceae bacterium]